jgi:hypothetical protein
LFFLEVHYEMVGPPSDVKSDWRFFYLVPFTEFLCRFWENGGPSLWGLTHLERW